MGEEEEKRPTQGEVKRLYASWYVYMILGVLFALWLPEPGMEENIFLPDQLAKFDGVQEPKRYLAILGKVFDVSEGEHYKPGNGYDFFVAKDASRGFATGKDEGEKNEEVLDMDDENIKGVVGWLSFYEKHDVYKYVGKVVGKYYDLDGNPTPELAKVLEAIDRVNTKNMAQSEWEKEFPGCNSRWTQTSGSELWCSDQMIKHRKLSSHLVPRRVFAPVIQQDRCACVEYDKARSNTQEFRTYPNCESDSHHCHLGQQNKN